MLSSTLSRGLIIVGLVFTLAPPLSAQSADYVVGPQDRLSITIWGQGGVSERFAVETDGTFMFPLLGQVEAGGLTVRQLQERLTQLLRDGYFKDPRITVVVEEFKSQHIFVVGEVKSPGTYSLAGQTTLVEALALAGATTDNAGSLVLVRRRTDGEASKGPVTEAGQGVTEIRVDLTALQNGVLSDNPILRDTDTIFVPRKAPVYVFGHVGSPGEFSIGSDATVRQVLSLAGGVSQRGAAGRIKILRTVGGTKQELKVDLDHRVNPGDTIIVPERFF